MTKYEEVVAVYEARRHCIDESGSHRCGGSCFALTAPRYAYNGGPYTPEVRLRQEALAGDEESLEALLRLMYERGQADGRTEATLLAMAHRLRQGERIVMEGGKYRVASGEMSDNEAVVTNYGSKYHRKLLRQARQMLPL